MQREQNLWGLRCLLWPAHAKLLIYAADSVLAFQFQAPTRFKNARCLFNCVSSTVYHSSYCYTVLNGFWTSIHLYVCAFLPFFLTQVFTPFHICASLFSASFCSSFLFSSQFSFISSFRALVSSPSTLFFCALHLTRLSPCLFQFSSQSTRNVRLLTTHIPPYSPRIVVIMLILTTLGWCPLNVISSKISAFLSADFQSTGSLAFKSHVPVFALLSPSITVAVKKRKSSLQILAR